MKLSAIRILTIEDQEMPWRAFERLLRSLGADASQIQRARWYEEAESMLRQGAFDVVFLDHRMPRANPGCTDLSDFDRFGDQVTEIGYGLVPLVHETQPEAALVGTSSLEADEIGPRFELPKRRIDKTNLWKELPKLFAELGIES